MLRGRVRSASCCVVRGCTRRILTEWRQAARRGRAGGARPAARAQAGRPARGRDRRAASSAGARRGRAGEGAEGDRDPGKRLRALGADARTKGADDREHRAMIGETVEELDADHRHQAGLPRARRRAARRSTAAAGRRAPRPPRPRPAPARALSRARARAGARGAALASGSSTARRRRCGRRCSTRAATWPRSGRCTGCSPPARRRAGAARPAHPPGLREAGAARRAARTRSGRWDISKLKGPAKWTCFHLYVILDVFSRYAVGWTVQHRENGRARQGADRPGRRAAADHAASS